MTLLTDPFFGVWLSLIFGTVAFLLCLYIHACLDDDAPLRFFSAYQPDEPLDRDYVSRLWAEDWDSAEDAVYDEWPQRQTPTDLAAAYLDHDEAPTVERHLDWTADPYWAQATQWLDEIKVDIRDALPAVAA